MNTKISQIQITSKLPGYLFLLANITNINDKIFLSCSNGEYEFFNSILKEIGIQAQPFYGNFTDDMGLFILDNIQQLNTIKPAKNEQSCHIIYIKNEIISEHSKEKVKLFLIQHPQYIIILDTELTVSIKRFSVNMNKANQHYEKIKDIG